MTNGKNGRKKSTRETLMTIAFIFIILISVNLKNAIVDKQEVPQQESISKDVEGELILTMIDVGQADCFLLMQNGETALIDCGTRSTGKDAVQYLKSIGIKKLDYVFGTHPHDDHMGGMYDIITNFQIGKVIIPNVKETITTNWYITLMEELKTKNYDVQYPNVGDVYNLGDATIKVLGPISEADDINNYSTVLKVSFGEMDIIMTGDAEIKVEEEILASEEDLEAEILKIGHHGSDTSSCDQFLDAISPDYALISTKIGNKYEHPMKSTMDKLKKRNIEVYRTDENGTVIVTILPESVSFNCKPGDYLSGAELEEKREGTQ